ncbi:kinase-like protein [Obba rivulosa]|uniref:Kinase-like protein n=1 Tax=Obba rivulosa TaxID=1052685 RepID=A0A8E2AXB4_9APHY|nr:kinase-like protein [Obba rivulosa]
MRTVSLKTQAHRQENHKNRNHYENAGSAASAVICHKQIAHHYVAIAVYGVHIGRDEGSPEENPVVGCLNSLLHDLDEATGIHSPVQSFDIWEGPSRREILDFQRKLCGNLKTLPKSCILPPGTVQRLYEHPQASGGFADVWKGQHGERVVALKVLRGQSAEEDSQTFFREAVIWKRLRHRNIVTFYGIDKQLFRPRQTMVSAWMSHGTVSNYLYNNPAADRIKLVLDAAEGLEYLQKEGIVHGDLKGANILVDEEHIACLSDFGLAALHYTRKPETESASIGSTRWTAPELFDPERFKLEKAESSPQIDIYALSMVMWEIFTGRVPFYYWRRDATVIHHVVQGKRPLRPVQATPLGLSDAIWALMQSCWESDGQQRPHIDDVVGQLRGELMERPGDHVHHTPQEWPLNVSSY